jgi:hypothetical protein
MQSLTVKTALQLVGGLSKPSKMPGFGYSIPAQRCQTGSLLRKVEGSVCSKCYALKGRYAFGRVRDALERRFQSLSNPLWVQAMAIAINGSEKSGFFRWHDSGDLQSEAHLQKIVDVCKLTPTIRHWLPTREYNLVSRWIGRGNKLPPNLTVRFSAHMLDGPAPTALAERVGVQTSGVSSSGWSCPASLQGNSCGDCRACWDKRVANVNYKKH